MRSSRHSMHVWLSALVVGLVAAIISVGRLWLADRTAPGENLWAEDGLFTLCIHKADFWTCLTDPFAGYLLFAPRVLVWPISALPWEHWALAANVMAALLAGIVSGLACAILRRAGLHGFVSVAVSLLPVLAPMAGLEAVNALGSSYMLLLFLATLFLVLPPREANRSRAGMLAAGFVLMLITALTIPSAVVLIPILVAMVLRGAWSWRAGAMWLFGLILGLAAQLGVALTADAPRQLTFGAETLNAWAEAIPVSILTYWPGLSIGEYSFFTNFQLAPLGITGWLIVGVLVLVGVWLAVQRTEHRLAIGVLILAGLGLGLIPSAIGYANNRYFVVPLLLWGSALLIALDGPIHRARPWIIAAVTALVLLLWWPAMPASAFRATPAPAWTEEVARVEARCLAEPDVVERPIFTPFWPPNWGDGLTEPTHPNLPCPVVFRWMSP